MGFQMRVQTQIGAIWLLGGEKYRKDRKLILVSKSICRTDSDNTFPWEGGGGDMSLIQVFQPLGEVKGALPGRARQIL